MNPTYTLVSSIFTLSETRHQSCFTYLFREVGSEDAIFVEYQSSKLIFIEDHEI